MRILEASSRQTAYDNGFRRAFCTRTLVRWEREISGNIRNGNPYHLLAVSSHSSSVKTLDMIEEQHPGYIEYLLHKSLSMRGSTSSFTDLAF